MMGDTLSAGQQLNVSDTMYSSDGRLKFALQGDGNLVLSMAGVPLWSPDAGAAASARMQGDGNFALYDAAGAFLWGSSTNGHPGSVLRVQNDGNVVIYDSTG